MKLVTADSNGSKHFTPALKEQFSTITKRAFDQLIGDKINEWLKGAMTQSGSAPVQIIASKSVTVSIDEPANEKAQQQVVTTLGELEGFYKVRAMLRDIVQPKNNHNA